HKDHIGAVGHSFDLIPLGGIGDRHPDHGLIAFETVQRQAQIVAGDRQHGSCLRTILLCPGFLGKRGGEHFSPATARPALELIPDSGQQGIAINAHPRPWWYGIQTPLTADGAHLPDTQGLMPTCDTLGTLVDRSAKATIARAMTAGTWGVPCYGWLRFLQR